MKNLLSISLLTGILFSCAAEKDPGVDEAEIFGKWLLTEQLADPGDGSGTFKPITSDKTIEFFNNGKFISNFPLCYLAATSGETRHGTFSLTDNLIFPDDCQLPEDVGLPIELDGNTLTINYLCIEACAQRFKKVKEGKSSVE